MKTIFAAALLMTSLAGLGAASAAMPVVPSSASANPAIIQVAGGCGPGFHRGPYGGCRVNRGRVFRPPVVVGRRCPPGFFMSRFGCRRI